MKSVSPEVVSVEDLDAAFRETVKKVLSWSKFKPNEVVVLAPEGTKAMWPEEGFTRSFVAWLTGKGVLITSLENCKFIEADGVVVIEMLKDNFFDKCIARSRARKVLTVFQVGVA